MCSAVTCFHKVQSEQQLSADVNTAALPSTGGSTVQTACLSSSSSSPTPPPLLLLSVKEAADTACCHEGHRLEDRSHHDVHRPHVISRLERGAHKQAVQTESLELGLE